MPDEVTFEKLLQLGLSRYADPLAGPSQDDDDTVWTGGVLQSPNLDNRTWKDLVDECRSYLASEFGNSWSDLSPADPGMALIETLAFLVDKFNYQLNRVSDKMYVEFLKLIGIRRRPVRPSSVELQFTVDPTAFKPDAQIPKDAEITTVPTSESPALTFLTDAEIKLQGTNLTHCWVFDYAEPKSATFEFENGNELPSVDLEQDFTFKPYEKTVLPTAPVSLVPKETSLWLGAAADKNVSTIKFTATLTGIAFATEKPGKAEIIGAIPLQFEAWAADGERTVVAATATEAATAKEGSVKVTFKVNLKNVPLLAASISQGSTSKPRTFYNWLIVSTDKPLDGLSFSAFKMGEQSATTDENLIAQIARKTDSRGSGKFRAMPFGARIGSSDYDSDADSGQIVLKPSGNELWLGFDTPVADLDIEFRVTNRMPKEDEAGLKWEYWTAGDSKRALIAERTKERTKDCFVDSTQQFSKSGNVSFTLNKAKWKPLKLPGEESNEVYWLTLSAKGEKDSSLEFNLHSAYVNRGTATAVTKHSEEKLTALKASETEPAPQGFLTYQLPRFPVFAPEGDSIQLNLKGGPTVTLQSSYETLNSQLLVTEDRNVRLDTSSGLVIWKRPDGMPNGQPTLSAEYFYIPGEADTNIPRETAMQHQLGNLITNVTNPSVGIGGMPEESLTHAIARGRQDFRSRGRAVTKEDFAYLLLNRFPDEIKRVYCETDDSGAVCVYVYPGAENASGSIKSPLDLATASKYRHFIQNLALVGLKPTVLRVQIVHVKLSITFDENARPKAPLSDSEKELIKQELVKFLDPLNGGPNGAGWRVEKWSNANLTAPIYIFLNQFFENSLPEFVNKFEASVTSVNPPNTIGLPSSTRDSIDFDPDNKPPHAAPAGSPNSNLNAPNTTE